MCVADSEEEEDQGGLDEGEDRVIEELVRYVVLPACDLLGDAEFRDVCLVVTLPCVEGVWWWSAFLIMGDGVRCNRTSYDNT